MNLLASLLLACALGAADDARDFPVVVRATDLDVNGHANNARYVEYLQCGRWDWLDRMGYGRDELDRLGLTFAVARIEVDYKAECNRGDSLAVRTRVVKVGGKSVTLRQTILKGEIVAAEAVVVLVAVDRATHRSTALPGAMAAKFAGGR